MLRQGLNLVRINLLICVFIAMPMFVSAENVVLNPVQDTYLNRNELNYESENTLRLYTWPTDQSANRILMKFDFSGVPNNAIIWKAELRLYLNSTGGDSSYNVSVHKIINVDPVFNLCNWLTYDGVNNWVDALNVANPNGFELLDTVLGWKTFDVKTIVSGWVDLSSPNLGLMLDADVIASSNSYRYFDSMEGENKPALTLVYSLPEKEYSQKASVPVHSE